MKKLLLLLAVASCFAYSLSSCSGKKEEKKDTKDEYGDYETAEPAKTDTKQESSEDLIKQGQALVDANDCKTCHHPTNKIIGPSHTDVAKKYEFTQANVSYLSNKIISGGSGVWGEIPMIPHVDLSKADAEKMAMYVLSLDGEKPKF